METTKTIKEEKEIRTITPETINVVRDADVRFSNLVVDNEIIRLYDAKDINLRIEDKPLQFNRISNRIIDVLESVSNIDEDAKLILYTPHEEIIITKKQALDLLKDIELYNKQMGNTMLYFDRDTNCVIYNDGNTIYIDKLFAKTLYTGCIPSSDFTHIIDFGKDSDDGVIYYTTKTSIEDTDISYEYYAVKDIGNLNVYLNIYGLEEDIVNIFMGTITKNYLLCNVAGYIDSITGKTDVSDYRKYCSISYTSKSNMYNVEYDTAFNNSFSRIYPSAKSIYPKDCQIPVKNARIIRYTKDFSKCILLINEEEVGLLSSEHTSTQLFIHNIESLVNNKKAYIHNISIYGYNYIMPRDVAVRLYEDIKKNHLQLLYSDILSKRTDFINYTICSHIYYNMLTDNIIFEKQLGGQYYTVSARYDKFVEALTPNKFGELSSITEISDDGIEYNIRFETIHKEDNTEYKIVVSYIQASKLYNDDLGVLTEQKFISMSQSLRYGYTDYTKISPEFTCNIFKISEL